MKLCPKLAIISLIMIIPLVPVRVFAAAGADVTRIGLTVFGTPKQISISSTCELKVAKTDSGEAVDIAAKDSLVIEASKNGLSIEDAGVGASVTVAPVDPKAFLTIDSGDSSRKYRGQLEVKASGAGLRLVNVVSVEDYLLGVLPAEMPELFPTESLKAQAVAARTYLLSNRTKHASQGYELCDSTHCQSYGGMNSEKPRCSQAVADTCGEILTYGGKPAPIQYSADCGGTTRDCDVPYMCSVTEPEDIKHSTWRLIYGLPELEKKLVGAGVKEAEGLKSIAVGKTDASGWVLDVDVVGDSGSATVSSSKLRELLALKSTLFAIEQLPDGTVAVNGKGSGHGRGLCQVGAKGLAMSPHNMTFDQILAHYFPGTTIDGMPAPAPASATVAMVSDTGKGPGRMPMLKDEAPVEVKDVDGPVIVNKKVPEAPRAAVKASQKKERVPFEVRIQEP